MRRKNAASENTRFVWIPGTGPDPEALARLTRSGSRPSDPLQKAWFFGEPVFYPELLEHDLIDLCPNNIGGYLTEISAAASCMGLRGTWLAWLRYLLPRLIPLVLTHSDRDPDRGKLIVRYPYDDLVSAYMAMYPESDIDGLEVAEDVLETLGKVLMRPDFWEGEGCESPMRSEFGEAGFGASELYAAVFLFLKYLPVNRVDAWTRSMLGIKSPIWRAMLLELLLGSAPYLRGRAKTAFQLSHKHPWDIHPWWGGNEFIGGEVLLSTEANRLEFCRSLRENLTESLVLDWFDSFATIEGLEEKLSDWPERFVDEFFPKGANHFTL